MKFTILEESLMIITLMPTVGLWMSRSREEEYFSQISLILRVLAPPLTTQVAVEHKFHKFYSPLPIDDVCKI